MRILRLFATLWYWNLANKRQCNLKMVSLESFVAADRNDLIRRGTEPLVRAYVGGALAREEAQERADAVIADSENARAIRNRLQYGEALLGLVTLGTHCDLCESEVSYLLLPEFHGHGYASVALVQACDLAFATRGLTRVVVETQRAYNASVRILKRICFEYLYNCERFGASQSVYALVRGSGLLR
jgi:RimJ/RimL family protein N-acetyltransferase